MTQPPLDQSVDIPTEEVIDRPLPEDFDQQVLYEQLVEADLARDPGAAGGPWTEFREDGIGNVQFRNIDPERVEELDALLAAHSEKARTRREKRQTEDTNRLTIEERAAQALTANQTDIAQNTAWLTANPNAPAVQKEMVRQSTAHARQINGILRLMLNRLEAAD